MEIRVQKDGPRLATNPSRVGFHLKKTRPASSWAGVSASANLTALTAAGPEQTETAG